MPNNPKAKDNLTPGSPGNKGNRFGRNVSAPEFRSEAQKAAYDALRVTVEVMNNTEAKDADRIKAAEKVIKWSGLEVELTATVNANGDIINPIDRDALLAIAAELAEPITEAN